MGGTRVDVRPRREIVVALIGSGWIVRVHAHALRSLNHLGGLPARIRIKWIYGRRPERMATLKHALAIERYTTNWQDIVDDPEVDVVANAGTHAIHAPISLAAIAAGKHVLCEKPLALDSAEAAAMAFAASTSPVITACGFNYRFVPAVRLLHQMVTDERLGEIREYRGLYLQDWGSDPDWTGSQGSAVRHYAHLFDMVRHLVAEPTAVTATATSDEGQEDHAFLGGFELAGGATASLEGSSRATGWKARHRIELTGTLGAAWWDMSEFNNLHVYLAADQPTGLAGFRDILVTDPRHHPFMADWWEAGAVVGWESAFVHQWRAFLASVLAGEIVDPLQATFHDGLQATALGEAVLASARDGKRISLAAADPA